MLRSLMDREFCSKVHRKLASQSPDRIAKEIDCTADYDLTELWAVEKENRKRWIFRDLRRDVKTAREAKLKI